MDTDFDERFQKAVLDALGHHSTVLAMLRQEWIDNHEEMTIEEEVKSEEV